MLRKEYLATSDILYGIIPIRNVKISSASMKSLLMLLKDMNQPFNHLSYSCAYIELMLNLMCICLYQDSRVYLSHMHLYQVQRCHEMSQKIHK